MLHTNVTSKVGPELTHLLRNGEAKVVRGTGLTTETKEKESHPTGCCNHQSNSHGEDEVHQKED